MIDVDVEVDGVGEVVGGGEGAEAAGDGVEAVEGEDLDEEGETGGRRSGFRTGIGEETGVRVRVMGGGDGDGKGGVGVAVEKEDAEGEEDDDDEVVSLRRSRHPCSTRVSTEGEGEGERGREISERRR